MLVAVSSTGGSPSCQCDGRFGRAACFLVHHSTDGAWEVVENQALNEAHGAGLAAAQRIKALAPQVAVILLTLYGDLEWDARHSGADGFLVKSADSEEIIDLITHLGGRTAALRSPSMGLSPQGVTS